MSTNYAEVDFGDGDGGEANLLAAFLTALRCAAARRDPFTQRAVCDMVHEAATEMAAMENGK